MNTATTGFVLGYHGCDAAVAEAVFAGRTVLKGSENDYDWLGHGIYFWEHNPQRALEFARDVLAKPHNDRQQVNKPAVVGAVIDLGHCLNLLDADNIELVRTAYDDLRQFVRANRRTLGLNLPQNTGGRDRLLRRLDCAVIEWLHASRREERDQQDFDTVRAAFMEGRRLYRNAGFHAKNHIQLCVRRSSSIVGYFRPLDEDGKVMRFR